MEFPVKACADICKQCYAGKDLGAGDCAGVVGNFYVGSSSKGDPPFHPMLQNLKGVYYRWWITLHKTSLLDPFDPISTKLLTVPVKLDELAESIAASEVRQNSKG